MEYLITNVDHDFVEIAHCDSLDELINLVSEIQNEVPDDTGKLYAYALDNQVWETI